MAGGRRLIAVSRRGRDDRHGPTPVSPDHTPLSAIRFPAYAVPRAAQILTYSPESAHVMLLADGPAHRLYEQFGFHATAPESIGMELRL